MGDLQRYKRRARREEQKLVRKLREHGILSVRVPTSGTAGSGGSGSDNSDQSTNNIGLPDALVFVNGRVDGIEMKATEQDSYRFEFYKNESILEYSSYTTVENIPSHSWIVVRFMGMRKDYKKYSITPLVPSLMKGKAVTFGYTTGYTFSDWCDLLQGIYHGNPQYV